MLPKYFYRGIFGVLTEKSLSCCNHLINSSCSFLVYHTTDVSVSVIITEFLLPRTRCWKPCPAGTHTMHPNYPIDFPITCACGKAYSRDAWTSLTHDGVQSGYHEGKRLQFFEDLEMRRCACGSTMSVPLRLVNQQGDARLA